MFINRNVWVVFVHLKKHCTLCNHIHIRKHEGRMFSCGQCDETNKRKPQLREHLSNKHESKLLLICGKCDKRFKTTAILNKHDKAVHNKVLCAECKYFTYGKITMKHHKRRVHEGLYLKHQCDYCSFHTNERGKLKTHISSIHEGLFVKDVIQISRANPL